MVAVEVRVFPVLRWVVVPDPVQPESNDVTVKVAVQSAPWHAATPDWRWQSSTPAPSSCTTRYLRYMTPDASRLSPAGRIVQETDAATTHHGDRTRRGPDIGRSCGQG